MAEHLLRVENLVRRFGGLVATDNLSMEVATGELHAIIGPNGAGKTTLISQLTGQLMSNSGAIHFAGTDVTGLPSYKRSRLGLARSFQITSLLRDFTAADNVALAAQAHAGHSYRFWANARKERPLREYNFRPFEDAYEGELPGMSAFALRDGKVFHTYSSYSRGLDATWGIYQWLDRAPLGRNEADGYWFKRPDEFPAAVA